LEDAVKLTRVVMISAICLPQLGCAYGHTQGLASAASPLSYTGSTGVAVAVFDQRAYIRSGDKPANFVGLQRGRYGNPFDVTTDSGNSLASEMNDAIVASLQKAGFEVASISTSPNESLDSVQRRLARKLPEHHPPAHGLLVEVKEWKADTYVSTSLSYDVTGSVYDAGGLMLAQKRLHGLDKLEGDLLDPAGAASRSVPAAFTRKLGALLNDGAIANALR
jgi:hypothetical protein